jgi:periplasmic glucans biosynthesis protein
MFMHGPMVLSKTPDYRPAVHDSEALAIITGNDEQLWRPLNNPKKLQVSAFIDEHLKGFGLIQRNRDFYYYQDLEAKYHLRPSAWVKPIGDWGKGHVELIEIPSDSEINDNIVAYWQPAEELKIDQPFTYSYRLIWPDDLPSTIFKTRIVRSSFGEKLFDGNKEIVVDYSHLNIVETDKIQVEASISRGSILESIIDPNPYIAGARVFFSFDPENADMSELRLQLKKDGKPIAPTWLYRWTNQN